MESEDKMNIVERLKDSLDYEYNLSFSERKQLLEEINRLNNIINYIWQVFENGDFEDGCDCIKIYDYLKELKGEDDMFNTFEEEARKVLISAKKEIKDLKHPYVGTEHLLLSILKTKNDVSKKLKEYDLDYQKFRKQVVNIVGIGKKEPSCFLYTPLLKRVMETAMIDSRENNNGIVTINYLFSALLEEGEGVAIRIMLGMNIDLDLLYKDFSYKIVKNKKNSTNKRRRNINMSNEEIKEQLEWSEHHEFSYNYAIWTFEEIDRLNNIIKKLIYECWESDMSYGEFEGVWQIAFDEKYEPDKIKKIEEELKENNKDV